MIISDGRDVGEGVVCENDAVLVTRQALARRHQVRRIAVDREETACRENTLEDGKSVPSLSHSTVNELRSGFRIEKLYHFIE